MPLVLPLADAAGVLEDAGRGRQREAELFRVARDELPGAFSARHEADLLALFLVGRRQAGAAGMGAHLVLGQVSDREPRRRELRGRQIVEEVGLVLRRIPSFLQLKPSRGRVRPAPRVVAGRDGLAAHDAGAIPERRELHLRVAGGAGNRRFSGEIGGDEGTHDPFAEFLLEVENVVRDAESPGHPARVGEVVERAAAPRLTRIAGMVPELHREADDLVPLFLQKQGGDRGVHSAGHGDSDAHARDSTRAVSREP